jgi:2-dehydropantoate 2-reductase
MKTHSNSVLIVGTGAMASLFAARLVSAGIDVKMLGIWNEGLQALRTKGVRFVDEDGHEKSFQVDVIEHPAECLDVQLALVLVKTWQTARAAQQLAVCLARNGLALTLQNGLGNLETLHAALGDDRTALGVTTVGATLLEPGLVKNGGNGIISLGKDHRLTSFARIFRKAGFVVEEVTSTDSLAWGKLVINAAINPITALLQIPNGEILELPAAASLMAAVAKETARVAKACEIQLPYADPVLAVEIVAQRTASNLSSMLRDIIRGGPTEVDAINGAVVRVGEALHIPTPVNRTLWQLVKAMEGKLEGTEGGLEVDTLAAKDLHTEGIPLHHQPVHLVA